MQMQINSDRNIGIDEARQAVITDSVESALGRFSEGITLLEVHLSDQNSDKKGGHDDIRCLLEARLEGHQPIAVAHRAADVDLAVEGATVRLIKLIKHSRERLREQQSQRTDPDPSAPEPEDES
ncbi:HPF/RaiA family ribosome-associated protein [Desulfonatronum sp. SC1]|uniref:HPF/RaiA family ribosome-associated protein n=1 Tax=Desulfonatronum sp. SC1 TaxID=2109626 RepID=UPI000D3112EC|nr:HPF/RaiA family ribosome-associated protein [Desulfonatronum sp. SC1]PTN36331.1 ribosomal subunit interface protein [Desulfonatronum sp. SC1]